jgi:tetratricopeptide (TPR) repeat protein
VRQRRCFYNSKDFEKAILYLDELILKFPNNGQWYFYRGDCLAIQGSIKLSNIDCYRAIELEYRLGDCYFNIGCNYLREGNDVLALKFMAIGDSIKTVELHELVK